MKVKRKKVWAVFLLIILSTTTGSADREFRADGITDKDKCYTADIFSCRGSDFGGRQAVSPVFSETAADTYRGQPGDYLLHS